MRLRASFLGLALMMPSCMYALDLTKPTEIVPDLGIHQHSDLHDITKETKPTTSQEKAYVDRLINKSKKAQFPKEECRRIYKGIVFYLNLMEAFSHDVPLFHTPLVRDEHGVNLVQTFHGLSQDKAQIESMAYLSYSRDLTIVYQTFCQ